MVSFGGYALNLALLAMLVAGTGVPHQIAQLFTVGLIALVMLQPMPGVVFPNTTPGEG